MIPGPDGGFVDMRTAQIGLRTVELVRDPDPDGKGESFKFRINGEDVFIKGANWIPADSFPGRLVNESGIQDEPDTAATGKNVVESLLIQARDAGYNMLRVWGGGLYESDHFYEVCDRLGILVWQDFPYACAYYPDRGAYLDIAREEAVRAVRRLRNHPSLALWCGNNENSMMFHQRWTGDNTPERLLGEPIYLEVLPGVLREEDPTRPYWPSSPYGAEDPNGEDHGDRHNWEVWHSGTEPGRFNGDWPGYGDDFARFCSEFGFAASCGLAAWDTVLDDSDKNPYSPAVRWHDKTRKGYETYINYIALHYPLPQTLSDLVYYSQCNQAEALKFGVEPYRRLKGRCWGTLIWQINDCWPVQSWAMIDYVGQPKAAYFTSKRFYAPLLLSLKDAENGAIEAHFTNDRMEPVRGTVSLCVETFEGEHITEVTTACEMAANATGPVATLSLDAAKGRERDVYVSALFEPDDRSASVENVKFLAEPKDLRLADPGLTVDVAGNRVTITAQRFAPYVWLRLIDVSSQAPPKWSDNFFHLRPGESRNVTVTTDSALTPAEIRARLAIRTL
jgi:beta-mannosidase